MQECRNITKKGKVTIPEAIRTELELRIGDRVIFSCEGKDLIMLKKGKINTQHIAGLLDKYLKTKAKGVLIEEMITQIKSKLPARRQSS